MDFENEYTSCSQPGGGKGYTPRSTHTLTVDAGKENLFKSILLVVEKFIFQNAGKKLVRHRQFHRHSN
jgi:hypothetical protein